MILATTTRIKYAQNVVEGWWWSTNIYPMMHIKFMEELLTFILLACFLPIAALFLYRGNIGNVQTVTTVQ